MNQMLVVGVREWKVSRMYDGEYDHSSLIRICAFPTDDLAEDWTEN
jgi:hypothetical protein